MYQYQYPGREGGCSCWRQQLHKARRIEPHETRRVTGSSAALRIRGGASMRPDRNLYLGSSPHQRRQRAPHPELGWEEGHSGMLQLVFFSDLPEVVNMGGPMLFFCFPPPSVADRRSVASLSVLGANGRTLPEGRGLANDSCRQFVAAKCLNNNANKRPIATDHGLPDMCRTMCRTGEPCCLADESNRESCTGLSVKRQMLPPMG
eukprot:COSAG04_NODE_485_length_13542_cov_6.498549_7_plen_205_part_00